MMRAFGVTGLKKPCEGSEPSQGWGRQETKVNHHRAFWFLAVLGLTSWSILLGQIPGAVTAGSRDSAGAHYARGVDLFNEHDDTGEALAAARQEFLAALNFKPDHAPALSYLGLIALESNDTTAADSLFHKALDADSTCPEAHVGMAQLFRLQRRWQAGYDEATLAVRLAPESVFARWELVSEMLNRVEAPVTDSVVVEAIPHLQKLLEKNTDDRQAHLELAKSYEQLTRWKEAAAQYREVLRIGQTAEDMDVWVYTVHMDAARCYKHANDYPRAIEEMKLYLDAIRGFGAGGEEVKTIEEQIQEMERKQK